MTLPRPSSRPRAEILTRADAAVREHGGPDHARVFFKYDCAGCDRRVTVVEPNVLPTRARCDACDTWTRITAGGFSLQVRYDAGGPWSGDGVRSITVSKRYSVLPGVAYASDFER